MKPEEAIEVLRHPEKHSLVDRCTADLMAIEALEKCEKYKWHDLRKDPSDLPKGPCEVFVQRKTAGGVSFEYSEYESFEGYGYLFAFVPQDEVLKWRYADAVEEEE